MHRIVRCSLSDARGSTLRRQRQLVGLGPMLPVMVVSLTLVLSMEEVKSLHILGITFESKLTFETHLHKVVSKAARSLSIVRRAGELFDCQCVLKSCFKSCVLSSLEYCVPV